MATYKITVTGVSPRGRDLEPEEFTAQTKVADSNDARVELIRVVEDEIRKDGWLQEAGGHAIGIELLDG